MFVITTKNSATVLKCVKQKDAALFKPIGFRLVETSGSCAVQIAESEAYAEAEAVSTKALAALKVLSQTSGLKCKDWLNQSPMSDATFYLKLKELTNAEFVTKDGDRYVVSEQGRAALALA